MTERRIARQPIVGQSTFGWILAAGFFPGGAVGTTICLAWERNERRFAPDKLWLEFGFCVFNWNRLRLVVRCRFLLSFRFDFGFGRFLSVGLFPDELRAAVTNLDRSFLPLSNFPLGLLKRILENVDDGKADQDQQMRREAEDDRQL